VLQRNTIEHSNSWRSLTGQEPTLIPSPGLLRVVRRLPSHVARYGKLTSQGQASDNP
jgi:hypothetical protein